MKRQWIPGLAGVVVLGMMAAAWAEVATTSAPATMKAPLAVVAADKPSPKMDGKTGQPSAGFIKRHEDYVALAKKGGVDLYFVGDSITDGWHGSGKTVWAKEFGGWNAENFGIGGDRTEHVLWRLENGELEGVTPKVFVMMIGTNNSGNCTPTQIAAGNTAIIKKLQATNPQAKILLLAIFPRGADGNDAKRKTNMAANEIMAKEYGAEGSNVKYMDIGPKFLDEQGGLSKEIMPDLLHPNEKGYQIWADAIKPVLTEWLGAPAAK